MTRLLYLAAAGVLAAGLAGGAAAQGMQGMEHGQMGHGGEQHAQHAASAASAAGQPGDPARASRTVKVTALDTMRFEPAKLAVKAGETVRFEVTNAGKVAHEFTIGDAKTQREHEEMMQKMPGMKHDDPNSVSLAPGETKTLVWQFGKPGTAELGCHEPGHYPAGMRSLVAVAK